MAARGKEQEEEQKNDYTGKNEDSPIRMKMRGERFSSQSGWIEGDI